MYPFYYHLPNGNPYPIIPASLSVQPPYFTARNDQTSPTWRQQPVRGQASWNDGGQLTKCEIPWSDNEFMTVAVSANSPYRCGETLKIRNLSSASPREILVKVVDQVAGYPANNISLHRRAFLALGANLSQGIIKIEIHSSPNVAEEEWGKFLLGVTQSAYPNYQVTDYQFINQTKISPTQIKRTYQFTLKSAQEERKVQGNVIYHPTTKRVISFDIKER